MEWTGGTTSTGGWHHTTPTVVLDVGRHVVVDDMLDPLEVQPLGSNVCRHQHILAALPELLDGPLPVLLICM